MFHLMLQMRKGSKRKTAQDHLLFKTKIRTPKGVCKEGWTKVISDGNIQGWSPKSFESLTWPRVREALISKYGLPETMPRYQSWTEFYAGLLRATWRYNWIFNKHWGKCILSSLLIVSFPPSFWHYASFLLPLDAMTCMSYMDWQAQVNINWGSKREKRNRKAYEFLNPH